MIKHLKNILTCITSALLCAGGYCQSDTSNTGSYENLSLKELLNVKIVSVSKNPEFLFDAPLSASVVTREEIQRTGCTSVMEALRLVPGVIVRQQSNGNYDIHIRGMDNVPPNGSFDIVSTTMLVMIDSRPIYSYLRGGTFWETLPIDINDVEKIEVIRGPAGALYGPNAVNGVINIITRKTNKEGLYVIANAQQGSYHTVVNNASLGYQSNKWKMIASGNYQARERTQESYYEFNRNRWLDKPEYFIDFSGNKVTNVDTRYPAPRLAMLKYAGNVFLNYDADESVKFNLDAGIQHSMVQKVSSENEITPLSTAASDSRYVNFQALVKGISAQFSYNRGTQVTDYAPGNKYDFNTFDGNIEYTYTKGPLSIRPGISYRSAVYDDTHYSDTLNNTGIFNSRGKIITQSAALKGEYSLLDNKLRLVVGLAVNKFNYPDAIYTSTEFATTYKINKKNLVRMVYSRAPRSSTIYDTYVNQTIAFFPSGFKKYTWLTLLGNKQLKLQNADLFGLGYRARLNALLDIDVELFNMHATDYNVLVSSRPFTQLRGSDTILVMPIVATNLPLKVKQQGLTISLTYNSSGLMLKPFITLQRTNAFDYAPYLNTADAGVGPNNIYSGMGTKTRLKSTPSVFGGASANYILHEKINLNVSIYSYSGQTFYHLSNILFNDGIRGIDHIKAKMIVNATVAYEPVKGLSLFCSGKNLLNDRSREFFKSDVVPFMLLGGMHYEL